MVCTQNISEALTGLGCFSIRARYLASVVVNAKKEKQHIAVQTATEKNIVSCQMFLLKISTLYNILQKSYYSASVLT